MATITPVAYYTGSTIPGTTQVGNLSVGTTEQDYGVIGANNGITYVSSPNQSGGYIIAHEDFGRSVASGATGNGNVGFWRTPAKTDESFLNFVNALFLQSLASASAAKTYLNNNGYWTDWAQVGVAVGDSFGGGTVAYILQPGDSGYDPNVQHGYILSLGQVLNEAPHYGFGNWSTAATGAANHRGGGFSDWRLPTLGEFNNFYPNRSIFQGGLSFTFYWTSTDGIYGGKVAFWVTFGSGNPNGMNTTNNNAIRALRTF